MVSRKLLGVALVLPLALAACSTPAADPTPGPAEFDGEFTVYASLAVTGPLAGIAEANIDGLNAAVETINANGGIDGREVKLIVGDDGADPTKAATLLQEQLDSTEIDFVVAGNTSNVGLALLPILTREELFSTGQQAAINDPAAYPYHFGYVVPNATQNKAMVEKIVEDGYEKVAMLHANDANGTAVADAYRKLFTEAGVELVDEAFAPADLDMTAQLQRLQAQDPDVLLLDALGSPAGYVLQSRTKIGWEIPTLGHSSVGSTDLASLTGPEDWVDVEVMTFAVNAAGTERSAGFGLLMDALHEADSKLAQPISQYTVMWDLLWVAKYAFDTAGGDDTAALQEVYESLDLVQDADSMYTFMPYIKYTPESHQLVIEPLDAMAFISPGPFKDGLIQ